MQFFSYLINGISLGSVYALIALGYTMVYGIAKMLNFAHGDVIMIGSYVVFFAFGSAGMNPVLAIVLSMVVCTVLGVTIERVAYRPLREAPSLAVLITAIGVSYLLQQVAQLAWTSNPKSFTSVVSGLKPISLFGGQLTISAETVVTIIACIVIMVVLIWFALAMALASLGHSVISVNLMTLGGLWRREPGQKSRISAAREGFGLVGLILAVVLPSALQQLIGRQAALLGCCPAR